LADFGEANIWLNLAECDYAIALHLHETFIPLPVETVCFHSQQAVEKALKAVLAYYEAKTPKTHNIRALAELCKEHTGEVLIDDKVIDTITTFAVITRYVEDRRDFTEDTAQFALKQAKQAIDVVKRTLEKAQAVAEQDKA
jgi:HEPN domain-containing protein